MLLFIAILVATVAVMELVAYLMHKHLMHGPLWFLHESHHRRERGRFELNDLFGIQSRGGCSCAGPYGHRLLGIDLARSHEFEREIGRGCEGIKPGWVRVNFNYFISEAVFQYIVGAVDLVAAEGWKLLPYYRFSVY